MRTNRIFRALAVLLAAVTVLSLSLIHILPGDGLGHRVAEAGAPEHGDGPGVAVQHIQAVVQLRQGRRGAEPSRRHVRPAEGVQQDVYKRQES